MIARGGAPRRRPGKPGEPDDRDPRGKPTIGQLLAEELVTELVRRHVDIPGLLRLELEVVESVRCIGGDLGATAGAIPLEALASTLLDQAFATVVAQWREQRRRWDADDCVCCALEEAAERRRQAAAGRPPGVPGIPCRRTGDVEGRKGGERDGGDDGGGGPDDRSVS